MVLFGWFTVKEQTETKEVIQYTKKIEVSKELYRYTTIQLYNYTTIQLILYFNITYYFQHARYFERT